MIRMSHLSIAPGTKINVVVLAAEAADRHCQACVAATCLIETRKRKVKSLDGVLELWAPDVRCVDSNCPMHGQRQRSVQEQSIAPRDWSIDWELFAWMGHRRFARHWSVPKIVAELRDTYDVVVSRHLVEDYIAKYEVMVAARESDIAQLQAAYRDAGYVLLSIDGLQPEKGHETLYVVRDLVKGRVWFAEPLLSSAAGEVKRLFERAKQMAEQLGLPVRAWISDKQAAFVTGIAEVFPGVPHRYCQNHFLRDVAKQTLEQDSHAKVQMRRKVRGLRDVERTLLSAIDERESQSAAAPECTPPADSPEQVALDYCAATRGILNDDQGGPLRPPGLRMAEALGEVSASCARAIESAHAASEKGALYAP